MNIHLWGSYTNERKTPQHAHALKELLVCCWWKSNTSNNVGWKNTEPEYCHCKNVLDEGNTRRKWNLQNIHVKTLKSEEILLGEVTFLPTSSKGTNLVVPRHKSVSKTKCFKWKHAWLAFISKLPWRFYLPCVTLKTHTNVQLTRATHLLPSHCSLGASKTAQGPAIRVPLPWPQTPLCDTGHIT